MGIRIISTGVYIPEQTINASPDTETSAGKQIDDLFTGGSKFHVASEHETNIYMGAQAAKQAIQNAAIDPATIDAAIGFTFVPDYETPRDIYGMIHEAGVSNATAWYLDTACASFASHLNMANLLSHSEKNVSF